MILNKLQENYLFWSYIYSQIIDKEGLGVHLPRDEKRRSEFFLLLYYTIK